MHVSPAYRMVVINFNLYGSKSNGFDFEYGKMYLLNYLSKAVQVIHNHHFGSMFTIKNTVYMSTYPFEATDSCHSFFKGECVEQIKIFLLIQNGTSNYSLSLVQELEDPNLRNFISLNQYGNNMMALPFQTSQSRLRHYKSVPIKDL